MPKISFSGRTVLGFAFAVCLAASLSGAGKEDAQNPTTIPNFNGLSREQADDATGKILDTYDMTTGHLLAQLRNTTSSVQSKVYVVYLLGQLRAAIACSSLIDNIDLEPSEPEPRTGWARWEDHPAEEALCKIGLPAVEAALERLKLEDNPKRRTLLCDVLTTVEGPKFAKLRLDDSIKATTNAKERDHLTQCISLIKGE